MVQNRVLFPQSVLGRFEDKYILLENPNIGSTGIVYRAHKDGDPGNEVAIKFYVLTEPNMYYDRTSYNDKRRIFEPDKKFYDAEFNFLRKFKHPGLQELISYGTLTGKDYEKFLKVHPNVYTQAKAIYFLVSKYVNGTTIDEWLNNLNNKLLRKELNTSQAGSLLVRCIIETAEILEFIHIDCKYLHSDIRQENVMIHSKSNRPIIIDFGNVRCFDAKQYTEIKSKSVGLVLTSFPEELVQEIIQKEKSKRGEDFSFEELKEMMFPSLDLFNFGQFIQFIVNHQASQKILSSFEIEFLTLIMLRLTRWRTVKKLNTSEILEHLKKLSRTYWYIDGKQYPVSRKDEFKNIALPRGFVHLSDLTEQIIQTRAFRRLEKINQLSMLYLIYPGAQQTRFGHSLAVYQTASELVKYLLKSPRFCLLFDSVSIQQILILALLHDINHFPFLHYFQELDIINNNVNILNIFCDGIATNDKPSIYDLIREVNLTPDILQEALFRSIDHINNPKLQVIKSIIDSGVDIDKITYVIDDSLYTGVPFGRGVDKETLLTNADISRVKLKNDQYKYHFCFKPEALSAVENLIFTRYWNFKQIYWHHANRAIVAMITYVVRKIFVDKNGDFNEYIIKTIGMSETEVVKLLNDMYKQLYKSDSILKDLFVNQRYLYKRLLSIKRSFVRIGQNEETYFQEINSMKYSDLSKFLSIFINNLNEYFKSELDGECLDEKDVLIDIPGRKLHDEIGNIYIYQIAVDGTPEFTVNSPFIEQINNEFLNLTRTIRFFISPYFRNKIGKQKIESKRDEIYEIISDSLKNSTNANMIK